METLKHPKRHSLITPEGALSLNEKSHGEKKRKPSLVYVLLLAVDVESVYEEVFREYKVFRK